MFYPAIRAAMREQDLIDEAEVEHASAKTLIADLQQLAPEDRAHAADARQVNWDDLLRQMTARR